MKFMAQTFVLLLAVSFSRSIGMRRRAQGLKVEQAIKHRMVAFTLNHRTFQGGSYG